MLTYLWVGLGGGLGTLARFWLSGWVAQRVGETFPWGTLAVNVTGSLVIGILAGLGEPEGRFLLPATARQFFMIGVCGGYTTFSSFSLQTLNLAREGDWLKAGVNVVASVVACLAAVGFGHALAMNLNK